MYSDLQNVLSAHRSFAAALTTLYELVHAEKRASALMHPSSWNVYGVKSRAAQQQRNEAYSVMEKLFGASVFQAAVALFGHGEFVIEMALQDEDPEESETGAMAMRIMSAAKAALQLSMSGIKDMRASRTIRGCSEETAKAIRAEIEAATVVRNELGEAATTLGLAEKQGFKNARADYHAALSNLEVKLETLQALNGRQDVEELDKAFETFVTFVQAKAADKVDAEWNDLVAKARPLFI